MANVHQMGGSTAQHLLNALRAAAAPLFFYGTLFLLILSPFFGSQEDSLVMMYFPFWLQQRSSQELISLFGKKEKGF